MMIRQVPFIDREDEQHQMDDLAKQWGTRRILCINGEGGIGKTRLLQEVHSDYLKGGGPDCPMATPHMMIDFDNHIYHQPVNLGSHVAAMLGKKEFASYFQIIRDLNKMQRAGISPESLKRKGAEADRHFADCFNKIGKKKRIALFMDTTDALKGRWTIDYLLRLLPSLENLFLVMAGRNAEQIGSFIRDRLGERLWFLKLRAFDLNASRSYLLQKQRLAHVSLDENFAEKLVFLSDGRPILLDLAVEWRKREIPLDWLTQTPANELESLPAEEQETKKAEFEKKLVGHIRDTRHEIDWLILLMAIVYPIDPEILAELLDIREDHAQTLFDEARGYVFVKQLPDGRISLHDEMRRMVNDHVWNDVDPDHSRRYEYLSTSVELYSGRIESLESRSEETDEKDISTELNDYNSRESLELGRWHFKKSLLDHLPVPNNAKTVGMLIDLFDETTHRYRYSLRKEIAPQMDECVSRLSPDRTEEKFELNKRRIKYLQDNGDYEEANDLVGRVLNREDLTPAQKIEMWMQKGNVEIRLGNLKQGIENFETAVQISEKNNFKQRLAQSLTARGWAYRNTGDFERALSDYLKAYGLCIEIRDIKQAALISNNMGFIFAYKGEFRAATENCRSAIELNLEMGLHRELGLAYSNMGKIHDLSSQQDLALEFYRKAMTIFESESDVEWISRVRCHRASVYLSQNRLDEALDDLNYSHENGPKNLFTRILFLQSVFYEIRNELGESRKKLDDCHELSKKIGDSFFEYASFSKSVSLAGRMGEFDRWRQFREALENRFSHRKSEMDLRLRGTALRGIGDLAVCNGDYEAALAAYQEGFLLIVQYENLPQFAVGRHLKRTERLICPRIEKETLRKLGRDLSKFWINRGILMRKSPEVLLTFQQWER